MYLINYLEILIFLNCNKMKAYLDNAATTPMAKEVIEAMTDVMTTTFGNPSSIHSFGRDAKSRIESARRTIGKYLQAEPKEIIFTSGGTEADNMAIVCAVRDLGVKHIISSPIEHHAVEHSLDNVKDNFSCKISHVKLDEKGNVNLSHLEELLINSKEKVLVSLMHANNEIATLLPLKEVGELCKKYNAYFHSDTVQTLSHYPINLEELNIDFITCAAHKFHGPKGVGFLYKNKNIPMKPLIEGGAQERGMRGGTENISGIIGLTKAFELANTDIDSHIKKVQGLKTYMITELQSKIDGIDVIGEVDPSKSLYTVLNVLFPKFGKQDMLLFMLDLEGIACSGGSACTSGADSGSHVLSGIKTDPTRQNVRFSFSRYTTKEEIDFTIEKVVKIINP
jgi:cysteine desulfurase